MFGRNNDGDQAELLARRMEQYEQTLRVMYQRITESRSHQHALGFNYEQLMVSHRTEIGKMIEGLYSGNDNVERATETEGDLCSMVPNGARFPHSPILHYACSSLFKENNSAYL